MSGVSNKLTEVAALLTPDTFTSINKLTQIYDLLRDAVDMQAQPSELQPILTTLVKNIPAMTYERAIRILAFDDPKERRRSLRRTLVALSQNRDRTPAESEYPTTGWIGAYLETYLETETPLAWHFWSAVSCLGSCMRRNVYLDTGQADFLYGAHFIILVGPSGLGKSAAWGPAIHIIHLANELCIPEMISLKRTQIEDCRVIVGGQKITFEHFIDALVSPLSYADIKVAETEQVHRSQSIGYLPAPEMAVLLGKDVKGAGRVITNLTELYGGKSHYGEGTRTKGVHILTEPTISLAGGTTHEWISKSMAEEVLQGGFTGRVIWAERTEGDAHRVYPFGSGTDAVATRALAEMLVPWMATPTPVEAEFTQRADTFWNRWYRDQKLLPMPDDSFIGYWPRRHEHVRRLAMVLCVSDQCDPALTPAALASRSTIPLDKEYLEQAIHLLTIEEARREGLFSRLSQSRDAAQSEYVLNTITRYRERTGSWPTKKVLGRLVYERVGGIKERDKIYSDLLDTGRVEIQTEGRAQHFVATNKEAS